MKVKKVMSAVCAVIMSVSVLAGCGDNDSSSSKDTKKDASSTAVVSESESEGESENISEEVSDEDIDDKDIDDEDVGNEDEDEKDDDTDDTNESSEENIDEIKYYNSDYWGDTGALYEIPEALWGNDLTDISTATSKMFGNTIKAASVFHTYSGAKTGPKDVPDVWYVSAGYTHEGYTKVEDNEGAYEVAYPFIEETAKYAYARMYDLDYATMPEDEILRVEIIEENSDEKTFANVPFYAPNRTDSYSWLSKDIKVVVFARERQVTFYLYGGFVKADWARKLNTKNVPMFVFAFSKDEGNKEYLNKIINHAFETLRNA